MTRRDVVPRLGRRSVPVALIATLAGFDAIFFAATAPLLPTYVDELGLSDGDAGLLSGAYAAGTIVVSLPTALLIRRLGYRAVIVLGLVVSTIGSVAFGFAQTYPLLVSARFFQGVGGAFIWIGGLSFLVALMAWSRRGELVGIVTAATVMGFALGPVAGGVATEVGEPVTFSALAALGLFLAAWTALTPSVDAPAGCAVAAEHDDERLPRSLVHSFWLVSVASALPGALAVLIPFKMSELGSSGVAIGVAFFAAAMVQAVASTAAGRLSDRTGRSGPIQAGFAIVALGMVGIYLSDSALLAAAAMSVVFVGLGACIPPATALLSDDASSRGWDQPTAFAVASMSWAGGAAVGAALAGAIAGRASELLTYGLFAAVAAATLAIEWRRAGG